MTPSHFPLAIPQLPFPSRISLRLPRTYNIWRSISPRWHIPLYPPIVREGSRFPSLTRAISTFPPSPSTPTTDNRPPRTASDSNGGTPADKLTHKWPRPRSSRSGAPCLRSTNPFLPRILRELRGAGGWSQGHMEAILRDSQGLGINWVGQWTYHK
jgi:hypothetical protein